MSVQGRRFLILVGALALVGAGVGGLWLAKRSIVASRIVESRARGLAAHSAGQFDTKMLRDLSYVAGRDRSDGEVLYALADTRRRIREENGRHILSAITFAQAAEDALPGDKRPLELLLELYSVTQFVGETLLTADKLLAIDPTNRLALQSKIRALQIKGSLDEALGLSQRLAKNYPEDIGAHGNVLNLMRLKGGPMEEREAYADDLAAGRPNDADALLLQARIAGSAGKYDKAIALVRRVGEMPLSKPASLIEAVRLMDLLRLTDESVALLEKQNQSPALGEAAALLAAERGWKAGSPEESAKALQRLVSDPSKARDGALGLAALLRQSGWTEGIPAEAEAELRSRTTPEATAWGMLLDARMALARGDIDQARPLVERLSDSTFATEITLFTRGQLELAKAEPARAVLTFEEAIRNDPRWLELRLLLVSTLADLGRLESAIEEAQRCASVFPRRLEPYNALARVTTLLIESGRASPKQVDSTLDLLDKLAVENMNPAAVVAMRARVLLAAGRASEAGAALAKALGAGVKPTEGSLGEWLAVARGVNRPETLKAIEAMAAAAPMSPGLALDRAMASAREGRIVEGTAALREAAAKAPAGEKATYERALAAYLDQTGEAEGLVIRERLADENPAVLGLQIDVLRTERAWTQQESIRKALERIKSLAGPESAVWKIGEARRLLTFESTPANAAAAAALLNDVLRPEPNNMQALLLLGEANLVLNDSASAITLFSKALDSAPREAGLYPRVIRMLQQTGASAEAERRLRDFVALGDIAIELRRQRAQSLVFQAMWPEAEADLRAIARSGQQRDRLALAEFLANRGKRAEAAPIYEEVAKGPEAEPGVMLVAAEFFAQMGDEAKGLGIIDEMRKSLPKQTGELALAGFVERRGRIEEAEKRFTAIAEGAQPQEGNLWAELAAFHIRRDEAPKAQEAVDKGLAVEPGNETLKQIGRLLAAASGKNGGTGLLDGAGLEEYQTALLEAQKTRPADKAGAGEYLGRLAAVTRRYPTYFNAWETLVREALALGERDLAATSAQSAARALPADPRAARLAAETLAEVGQLVEAVAMAKAWRDRSLRDPFDAELTLAGLEMRRGRAAEALPLLDKNRDRLVAQPGAHLDALSLYASLLSGSGRMDDARRMLASPTLAGDAKAQVFLAIGRGLYGKPDQARAWLGATGEGGGAVNMSNPGHALALGQAWYDLAAVGGGGLEDYTRAIDILSPLLKDDEHKEAAAGMLATACDQTGRFEEAERSYRVVLEMNPNQPVILNNLAYMLLRRDKGGASEETVRLAESAVRIAREQGMEPRTLANLMDTLGAVMLAAGRFGEAQRVFREAVGLEPDNPEIIAGLAQSLAAQGDAGLMEEARTLIAQFDRLARTKIITPAAKDRIAAARRGVGGQ